MNREQLMEQARQSSLNKWADAQKRALHETVRNTPVGPAAAAAAGLGTGSGGAISGIISMKWTDPSYAVGSLDEWNSFFDLLGSPEAFTSVTIDGDTTILSGTPGFNIINNVFSPGKAGNQYLVEFRDLTGCVNSVGDQAFANCDNLTTAILPAATSIGYSAFIDCAILQSVDISSATEIFEYAFTYCPLLDSISMPNVENIGPWSFGYSGLTSITGPNVVTIGDSAFENCSLLTSLSFPQLTSASNSCFSNCSSLTSVSFPQLVSAGSFCFQDCSSLTSISLPHLTEIGSFCFLRCETLTTISLPQLATVAANCFQNCHGLASISLPQCTNLGGSVGNNEVFLGVTGNTISVTIPVALMTCNIGDPDGDIQYLVANNTVTGLPSVQCNTLTLTGLNATTTSNSATNNATGGWDSSAYSTQTYTTPVILKFRTSNNSNILMGGFAYTPTLETDTYLNTTYGIYLTGSTSLEIYENGGQVVGGTSITRSVDDEWKVIYDGSSIKYYQNSTLIYTSANPVTSPLHVFFAFNTASQGVTNICAV